MPERPRQSFYRCDRCGLDVAPSAPLSLARCPCGGPLSGRVRSTLTTQHGTLDAELVIPAAPPQGWTLYVTADGPMYLRQHDAGIAAAMLYELTDRGARWRVLVLRHTRGHLPLDVTTGLAAPWLDAGLRVRRSFLWPGKARGQQVWYRVDPPEGYVVRAARRAAKAAAREARGALPPSEVATVMDPALPCTCGDCVACEFGARRAARRRQVT